MKISRCAGLFLLLALAAEPCSISAIRRLWAKKPGTESQLFAFERNGKVGFIDPTGRVVIEPTIAARIDDVGDFSDGRARVNNQGYVDETGKLVIARSFWWENDFSDGLALTEVDDPDRKFEKLGLAFDTSGKIVAGFPALRTRDFTEGLAAVEAAGKPGVRKFEPGNFIYRDYPGLKGFLDHTGNVVIKPAFADVGPFVNGLARAVLDGYCHIAIRDGGRQGTPTTGYPGDCGGAPADAVSPCKVGFINTKGNFAIQPRFESAQDFQEELAAVRIGGLWGFINREGITVIPPRFEQEQSFREGLAGVRIDGKWGFIDTTGKMTIRARFEDVEEFSDSLAIAYRKRGGGQAFFIDRKGNTKIAGPFREVTPFVHGLAAVLLAENHVAYIDHAGKTVFDYFRQ